LQQSDLQIYDTTSSKHISNDNSDRDFKLFPKSTSSVNLQEYRSTKNDKSSKSKHQGYDPENLKSQLEYIYNCVTASLKRIKQILLEYASSWFSSDPEPASSCKDKIQKQEEYDSIMEGALEELDAYDELTNDGWMGSRVKFRDTCFPLQEFMTTNFYM
jgi:hypothetical protein